MQNWKEWKHLIELHVLFDVATEALNACLRIFHPSDPSINYFIMQNKTASE